jgi:16S rRNA (adenine1518-N6/adenine1519-N6)-dimethyltransferase
MPREEKKQTRPAFRPRKRFGQHFLSESWAARVVEAIDVQPGDTFVEIGPGTGALTRPLARTGAPILAVEIDRVLAGNLANDAPRNVTIMSGDFLETDVLPLLSGLTPQATPETARAGQARRFRVVGNLPYNITSPILFRLLELDRRHGFFADATVMMQREVADRLVAKAGTKAYGSLTVMVSTQARVTRLLDLPPSAFKPAPKVRSSVVRLEFGHQPVRIVNGDIFERMVKAMFSQRRKTLLNALKSFDATAPAVLALAGIDSKRRPETLQVSEIARLAELFATVRTPRVV